MILISISLGVVRGDITFLYTELLGEVLNKFRLKFCPTVRM